MYVCLCQAVKDAEIMDAVRDGHASLDALADKLGVGTGCGGCLEYTEALIEKLSPIDEAYHEAA